MIEFLYADVSPLNDDEIFRTFYENASSERRKKIDAFRFRKDKNLSLGASVLLDAGLKSFGLCEKEMVYGTCENGKPLFKNRPDIFFNISHSGNVAAAAFSDGEIGIDIEKIGNADLKIAKRFFSRDEYRYLESLSEEKSGSEFYRLWTLKESFMKITGLGMKLPLNSFCIRTENGVSVECGDINDDFYFYEFDEIDGFRASICSHKKNEKLKISCISFLKG